MAIGIGRREFIDADGHRLQSPTTDRVLPYFNVKHDVVVRMANLTPTLSQALSRNSVELRAGPDRHLSVFENPGTDDPTVFSAYLRSIRWNTATAADRATKEHDELIALADEKGSLTWKALCTPMQGCLFALAGKASDAVQRIASGIAALRSTGTTLWMPLHSSYFARAYAELGQFDDAWRSIGEGVTAVETTKATCSKRANCWLRFTGGSRRGLTRAI
jgi:hypothetical protein